MQAPIQVPLNDDEGVFEDLPMTPLAATASLSAPVFISATEVKDLEDMMIEELRDFWARHRIPHSFNNCRTYHECDMLNCQ